MAIYKAGDVMDQLLNKGIIINSLDKAPWGKNQYNKIKIILASASPRRKELLELAGFDVQVIPSNIVEKAHDGETPQDYVQRNALEKGLRGLENSAHQSTSSLETQEKKPLVLAADTIVVTKNGEILEKPENPHHAHKMLSTLSAATHSVLTSYVIFSLENQKNKKPLYHRMLETKVTFRKLSAQEIDHYIDVEKPFDNSGGYAIQGLAAGFVHHIEGSYTNVMGLPLSHVLEDVTNAPHKSIQNFHNFS